MATVSLRLKKINISRSSRGNLGKALRAMPPIIPKHDPLSSTLFTKNCLSLPSSSFARAKLGNVRGQKLNPNIFFSNFSGASGISRQNPGISRQKSLIPWVSRDIPNFLAPTPSRGRPPPHQKISGLKSLGLGSFFAPEMFWKPPTPTTCLKRTAIHLQFVRQYAPHLHGSTFGKILGVGVAGTLLTAEPL